MKMFSNVLVNFLVRMMVGLSLIFFVNQFLETKSIEENVGINPITAITPPITPSTKSAVSKGFASAKNPPIKPWNFSKALDRNGNQIFCRTSSRPPTGSRDNARPRRR